MGFLKIVRSRRFCRWATLCMLFSVALLWVTWLSWRANRQRVAVAAVQACGGQVRYDWQVEASAAANSNPGGFSMEPLQPPGPKWLREIIGDEYFQKVVVVEPKIVAYVGRNNHTRRTPSIRFVSTISTGTPEWSILDNRSLRERRYEFRQMLSLVASLGTIRSLDLSGADVDYDTLSPLADMSSLRSFQVGNKSIWRSLPKTREHLGFGNSRTRSVSMDGSITKHLARLPRLKTLHLDRVTLDDADIERIASLQKLENLLINCHEKPLDLTPLDKLTRLKQLEIHGSVTTSGA